MSGLIYFTKKMLNSILCIFFFFFKQFSLELYFHTQPDTIKLRFPLLAKSNEIRYKRKNVRLNRRGGTGGKLLAFGGPSVLVKGDELFNFFFFCVRSMALNNRYKHCNRRILAKGVGSRAS